MLPMKTITANELKTKLENDEVLLIDVRDPSEHRFEYIEGALLIPLSELSLNKIPTQYKSVVLHCRAGSRSHEGCEKLLQQDSTLCVYSLEGGITAWKDAGFPVKKSGGSVLPLDRQVQVAVGFLAFSGVLLGTLIHPGFYVLAGFIGLGLMFAGFTGWCGMAKLLAKMPWNK